ncbi:MAG: polysaccharide deacetylase family protein [Candidatus Omnitrophota bacterium]
MRRQRIIVSILAGVLLAVFLLAGFLRQKYVVPVLMYHSINTEKNPYMARLIVSPQTFERQIRFLKNNRYNVLPLEEIATLLKEKKKIPPRTMAITFDDGYKDNYALAFPILKKYNLPATIFIIVNEVNGPDRLSWKEIRQMRDSGLVSFGSHCLGPEPLTNIKSEEDLRREIFASKKILEKNLGREVTTFSYPEGRFNDKIRGLVIAAGYEAAVATSPGRQYSDSDIFALKRLRISETSRNMFVFWIETSGFYTFIKERRDD